MAGNRRHPWFLDSWNSKDTKNDSSLDYEDAKDLPIELRRLEDFENFQDPPLTASLKSRSLGSILNPPPRQIVRSRSSVPSLGGPLIMHANETCNKTNSQYLNALEAQISLNGHSPTNNCSTNATAQSTSSSSLGRRPKLIKQKQSLCDEDYQLPDTPFHMISSYNTHNNSVSNNLYMKVGMYANHADNRANVNARQTNQSSLFLRKQSSLNEELMAGNRIREKERVRKKIQKQTSLNEAFLCRSALFSKRLQVIREGFTTKIKSSTGSLERVTKSGLNKIMQNFGKTTGNARHANDSNQPQYYYHHHHHGMTQNGLMGSKYQSHFPQLLHKQTSLSNKCSGPVVYCSSSECSHATAACYCSSYQPTLGCSNCSNTNSSSNASSEDAECKARRHSRESGSDSSKDSSLQSDTSIESEDSFASVIFIPKPEHQQQQQLNYQQQHQNSNSSSSNSSSSNGGTAACCGAKLGQGFVASLSKSGMQPSLSLQHHHHHHHHHHHQRAPSVPTSPLIMPCPPTPAHSPAAAQIAVTSPPQSMAAVTAAMAILTPPCKNEISPKNSEAAEKTESKSPKSCFSFEEAHIKQQQQQLKEKTQNEAVEKVKEKEDIIKITRQSIKDLPPIPKFRKQQSLQLQRQHFPIVRRTSAASGMAVPSIPKLLSLELFNPATDDLDSDSSEPSSPDSIDSVISAPRSASMTAAASEDHCQQPEEENFINKADDLEHLIKCKNSNKPKANEPKDKLSNCAEFAEQLSAQLMRELEDKSNEVEKRSLEGIADINEFLEETSSNPFINNKKRGNNGERDLTALREELRERRLLLANLSTQQSLQQSPTTSSSTSSRSFTIHEEDEQEDEEENERSYSLQLYENCKISKFNYKRNRQYNLNAETAYLLQEDGDSSIRDEEEEELEHDVIPEEDEDLAEESEQLPQIKQNIHTSISKSNGNMQANCQSTDSWELSNSSTASLDSPSQGGATTHHRYYHVFREGELDALINHHVASLHIVSSYYERASWCVVAEKVQVWTI